MKFNFLKCIVVAMLSSASVLSAGEVAIVRYDRGANWGWGEEVVVDDKNTENLNKLCESILGSNLRVGRIIPSCVVSIYVKNGDGLNLKKVFYFYSKIAHDKFEDLPEEKAVMDFIRIFLPQEIKDPNNPFSEKDK